MNTVHRPIRFLLNGQTVEIDSIEPTRSVLNYLREDRLCIGTKEGCAEGDCGACTVVLGELVDDELTLKPVNACIQFVPTLDGKALFTVEYLRGQNGSLHPVQQAMVDCHGSQCGFCTPGFVMSLWTSYTDHEATGARPNRTELATCLSGNLCRCTGYRPILDAGEAMFNLPSVSFDRAAIAQQLRALTSSDSLAFSYRDASYHAPQSLSETTHLLQQNPESTLLAGCTDVGLWVNKQFRDLGDLVYIGNVAELKKIELSNNRLRIGAGVSLTEAYTAIAEHYPAIQEMYERFASVPIRNAGTLGGNVANGSPIGDSMPWLIALEAKVVLASAKGSRTMPLEDLYTDYMKKSMQSGELVEAIEVPLPSPDIVFRTYKLSKRFDSDISAVCAAFALRLNNDHIKDARVAFGGMAATPARASACEAALRGQLWTELTAKAAMQALQGDFTPLDDMRASADYRSRTAINLLYRFFLETRALNPLPASDTSVFARTQETV
jgi:xanthine dehydrogenase small subunit